MEQGVLSHGPGGEIWTQIAPSSFFLSPFMFARHLCCVLFVGLESAPCRHVVESEEIGKEGDVLSFG